MADARAFALAVLIAASGLAAGATELGTLFHTPEERARLDRLRRGDPPEAAVAPGVARDPSVTGYVRRSDGRNTVWIDGTPRATRNDPRTVDPRSLPRPGSGRAGGANAPAEPPAEAQTPAPVPPKS